MVTPLRLSLVGIAFATVCFGAAGCSAPETPEPPAQEQPAAEQNDAGGTASTEGEALVSEKCSQCHSIDRVDAAVKDQAGWQATVDRMVRNGMEATGAEKATIVEWLTARDADR